MVRWFAGARGRWAAVSLAVVAALAAFANLSASSVEAAQPLAPLSQDPVSTATPEPPVACDIEGWLKTPPNERGANPRFHSCPTKSGLGDCKEGIHVMILNEDTAEEELSTIVRESDGGFNVRLQLNCRASSINWEILDDNGVFKVGGNADTTDYDEFDYVFQKAVVLKFHPADAPGIDTSDPPDGICDLACPGTPMFDSNGQHIVDEEAEDAKEKVKAYEYRFRYKNQTTTDENTGASRDTLNKASNYELRFTVIPWEDAPDNHIHRFILGLGQYLKDGPLETIKKYINPQYWIEVGISGVMEGMGRIVMSGMCSVMTRFMTDEHIEEFDTYPVLDSKGDFQFWKADHPGDVHHPPAKAGDMKISFVDGHNNPNVNNANMNCKRPEKRYGEQLEELREAAYALVNENRMAKGLPPMGNPYASERAAYARSVVDGVDPRARADSTWVDYVAYDFRNVTLFPRLVADPDARYNLAENEITDSETGITTFTGLLVGTPANLTYERGLVRIGWSLVLNVMVMVMVVFIAWIGLNQVVKSFTGSRNQADWRELAPRFILAIIAAVTSYWWCSLLVDTADGVSRYLAAGMRVSPADITGTLGQAVTALATKQAAGFGASFLVGGTIGGFVRVTGMTLLVVMMLIYAIIILMIIGQFIMRIVLINALIMLSPLAMILWALPETAGWGKKWLSTFTMTLWQHGLQILCFAMGLWFVKLGSPMNFVAGSGTAMDNILKKGVVGLALPIEMIWTFALGIMAMMLTFKLPGLLGNSIMETWTSTLSFAAMGARALMSMGVGLVAGGMSRLGIGGGGGAPSGGFMSGMTRILNPFGGGGGSGGGSNGGGDGGGGLSSNADTPAMGRSFAREAQGAWGGIRGMGKSMITGRAFDDVAMKMSGEKASWQDDGSEPITPSGGIGRGASSGGDRGATDVSAAADAHDVNAPIEGDAHAQGARALTIGDREDNARRALEFAKKEGRLAQTDIQAPDDPRDGFGRNNLTPGEMIQPNESRYIKDNNLGGAVTQMRRQEGAYHVTNDGNGLKFLSADGNSRDADENEMRLAGGVGVRRMNDWVGGGGVPYGVRRAGISGLVDGLRDGWTRGRQQSVTDFDKGLGLGAGSDQAKVLDAKGKPVSDEESADVKRFYMDPDGPQQRGFGDGTVNKDPNSAMRDASETHAWHGDAFVGQNGEASQISDTDAANMAKGEAAVGADVVRRHVGSGWYYAGETVDGDVQITNGETMRVAPSEVKDMIKGTKGDDGIAISERSFNRIGSYEEDGGKLNYGKVVGVRSGDGGVETFSGESAEGRRESAELMGEDYGHAVNNSVTRAMEIDERTGEMRTALKRDENGAPIKGEDGENIRLVKDSSFVTKENPEGLRDIRQGEADFVAAKGWKSFDAAFGGRDIDARGYDDAKAMMGHERFSSNMQNSVRRAVDENGDPIKDGIGNDMVYDSGVAKTPDNSNQIRQAVNGELNYADKHGWEDFDAKFGERRGEERVGASLADAEGNVTQLSRRENEDLNRARLQEGDVGLRAHVSEKQKFEGYADGSNWAQLKEGDRITAATEGQQRLLNQTEIKQGMGSVTYNKMVDPDNAEYRSDVVALKDGNGAVHVGNDAQQEFWKEVDGGNSDEGRARFNNVMGNSHTIGFEENLERDNRQSRQGRGSGNANRAGSNMGRNIDDKFAQMGGGGRPGGAAGAVARGLINRGKNINMVNDSKNRHSTERTNR